MSNDRRAVIYARVSTDRQADEGWSLPAQLKRLHEYAAKQGFEVVRVFEASESASSAGRAAFGALVRLLSAADAPPHLLVEKTDRVTRNREDTQAIEVLRLGGLKIHLVAENRVLDENSDPSELLAWDVNEMFARYQTRRLSKEVKKGMAEAVQQGNWQGPAPFGWRNRRDESGRAYIEPHPDEAPVVITLFEEYGKGDMSLVDLVQFAAERGFSSRNGVPFNHSSLHHLLRQDCHVGRVRFRKQSFPGRHRGLIDQTLFDRVQGLLTDKRRRTKDSNRPQELFTGLLHCGHCGCAVVTYRVKSRHGRDYVYYRCSGARGKCPERMLRQEAIDAQVEAHLRRLEFPAETVESLKLSVRSATAGRRRALDEAIGRLRAKQTRLEDRLRKAYEDRLDDRITTAEYDSLALQWRGELATIGTQLDAHQRENWEHMDEAVDFLDLIRQTAGTYATSKPARKRRILQAVLSNPRIRDGKVEADFRQPYCYVAVAAAEEVAEVAEAGGTSKMVGRVGFEPTTPTV